MDCEHTTLGVMPLEFPTEHPLSTLRQSAGKPWYHCLKCYQVFTIEPVMQYQVTEKIA